MCNSLFISQGPRARSTLKSQGPSSLCFLAKARSSSYMINVDTRLDLLILVRGRENCDGHPCHKQSQTIPIHESKRSKKISTCAGCSKTAFGCRPSGVQSEVPMLNAQFLRSIRGAGLGSMGPAFRRSPLRAVAWRPGLPDLPSSHGKG